MQTTEIKEYVSTRRKVAETYLEHGLLAESRKIFLQISRNLENFQRKVHETSDGFTEWFEQTRIDLEEKLDGIDRQMSGRKIQAIQPDPTESQAENENPNAVFHKGIGFKELGLFDEAVDCFRRALENGHPAYDCLLEYLDVCRQKENWADAEQEFRVLFMQQADLLDVERETLWRKAGVLYEKAGLKKEALDALKNAKRYRSGPAAGEQGRTDEPSEVMIVEAVVETEGSSAEDGEVANSVVPPEKEEETASLSGLTLDSESDPEVEPSLASEGIRALRDELDYIRSELAKAQELVQEYQQRYTAIMSQTNGLRKENRELKEKLAKGGKIKGTNE